MAVTVKRAETYAAFQYPNADVTQCRINIYAADGYKLYIMFQAEGSTLPANSYEAAYKTGSAYEHASAYAAYLDLLRHEQRVWVTFNEEAQTFVVYAAGEPVGEDEM